MSVLDRFRLDGKRFFITGGSRGLGRAMALALAEAGADAVLVGRDATSLEQTAADIRSIGRQAFTMQADVGKPKECEAVCRQAIEQHGPIDILINNVGGRRVPTGIGGRSYETAKAAVIQFTRATAVDWAPSGVTVNAICPGGFMTEPNIRWSRERPEIIEAFKKEIPLGDFGQPEDLGPLAVYLASDASRYMTGAA
ncbi:MAG: short-chain dehydrogenase, partial [Planctomycetia bacterium 21-64-5]